MKTLTEFLDRAKDYHILVAGDIMMDCYLWGSVDRISPEAPVPVLQLHTSERRLGGAANVALNLAKLGAKVSIIGIVGNDPGGLAIIEMLASNNIDHSFVTHAGDAKTTIKTRVIGGHQHLLRVDEEKHRDSSRKEAVVLREKLDSLKEVERPHAIILQDYNKGFLSSPMIRMLMNYAQGHKIPVCVDPKEENFFEYVGAAIFKPNLRELRARVPFAVTIDEKSLHEAALYLSESLKCQLAAITLSEHGIFLSRPNQSGIFPTKARTVVDVCGAGDAVIAVLTLGYLMGASMPQLAALANAGGGVVCSEVGVSPVNVEALRMEIEEAARVAEAGQEVKRVEIG